MALESARDLTKRPDYGLDQFDALLKGKEIDSTRLKPVFKGRSKKSQFDIEDSFLKANIIAGTAD